ncbi:MAG TPA: exodeoxyribonuclease VII large subunit [Planctomycetaceae bacterium]|nr:exodeoxyribonuclease VII large subunit [Planctomycetaceae bacterium]
MSTPEHILTVTQLTAGIKELLEMAFPALWVGGEISDLARPRSGHCYLTLKDDQSQIRAVVWRTTAGRIKFDLDDGLEVICRGRLEVYAPRGTYQLVIDEIQPKGLGALELALRQLREKLAAEGLFAAERKRRLPPFVRRIAVVTSPTGAALRDFLQVLGRRWRGADVLVVPTRVQGEGSADEIARAIAAVNRLAAPPDCLVVTRGGGSLEDLWAFNEEPVVRAIAASRVVVVSAVGHEIDVTLSDLAADVRAATPSEAAELVCPATDEIVAGLSQLQRRLRAGLLGKAAAARTRLDALARSRMLRRPFELIHDRARRLDELDGRAARAARHRVATAGNQVGVLAGRLESLSPLGVLGRGYSITRRTADGRVVRDASELTPGEEITTRFARGEAVSRVEEGGGRE